MLDKGFWSKPSIASTLFVITDRKSLKTLSCIQLHSLLNYLETNLFSPFISDFRAKLVFFLTKVNFVLAYFFLISVILQI